MAPNNDVNTIEYYGLDSLNNDKLQALILNAVNELKEKKLSQNVSSVEFVREVFDGKSLADLLVCLPGFLYLIKNSPIRSTMTSIYWRL